MLSFLRPPHASLPTSAYIHLPFCAQRCAYCAFPVIVSGRSSLPSPSAPASPRQSHAAYIDLLCREIAAVASRWRHQSQPPLKTLYLGGGTPSLLHPALLSKLLRTVQNHFPFHPSAEITCEMDPATFTPLTAHAYRALGINRASVGAQSFDDALLASCRRIHRAADIPLAMHALRDAGFDNISLDLISGLPGQTLATWNSSLDAALQLDPNHVSAYDLTIEPGTAFGNAYSPGMAPLPSEGLAADMMVLAATVLRDAGYEHYEVSNYSRAKRSCHNMAYWRNESFYAFGLGATSVVDGFRFARPRRMSDYKRYVHSLDALHALAAVEDDEKSQRVMACLYPNVKPISDKERLEDFFINSFRLLVDGVCMQTLREQFGDIAHDRFAKAVYNNAALVQQGSLIVDWSIENTATRVRLSEQGALIENAVLSTLLQDALWKFSN